MMQMKKIGMLMFLIVMLSGCHSQNFSYDRSRINLETELSEVYELMMDKGNYSNNLLVPYNKTSLYIKYLNNTVVVESIQFSVYKKSNEETHEYDATMCFNEDGALVCKETKANHTGEKVDEEVLLVDSIDIYSNIDVAGIVSEVKSNLSNRATEDIMLIAHLALPSDVVEMSIDHENIIFYYGDEYHYNDEYDPQEMMLEIKVVFFYGDGEGETFIFYFEI